MKPSNPWNPKQAFVQLGVFPWRLFFAVVAAVVAGHCFFGELHHLAGGHVPGWVLCASAFFAVLYAALVLHSERLKFKLSFVALALTGLGLFVLGTEAYHALHGLIKSFPLILVGAGLLALTLHFAHSWRHDLEGGRSLGRMPAMQYVEQRNPIRALILTVSKPDARPGDNIFIERSDNQNRVRFVADKKDAVVVAGPDINADLKILDTIRPNWQQLLRAILPHLGNLSAVILYGSKDSRLDDCREFLDLYLRGRVPMECLPTVELEDFDAVHRTLKKQVAALIDGGYRPEEVAVDITGGYKIPSVAGAVLTLNRAVVCQYVQSIGSEAEKTAKLAAQIYDLRWDKALELPA